MEEALVQAARAAAMGEVPVGAVVVLGEAIVGRGHNRRESWADPCAHAEILALRDAAHRLGRWRLTDCTLYATLEPCPMCAGALVNARVGTVVFGTRDPRAGAMVTHYGIGSGAPLNHTVAIREGVRQAECAKVLVDFFAARRR
jgi:tRNA(adenine34) deaminase